METGLGGVFDATNVIGEGSLDSTIIAPIEKEHLGTLGDSLEEIVENEIGVIKPNKSVIIAKQSNDFITQRILSRTHEHNCDACEVKGSILVDHKGYDLTRTHAQEIIDVVVKKEILQGGEDLVFKGIRSQLIGRHQHENIKTAILAALKLRELGWPIKEEAIAQGIQDAFIPARFQVMC